MAFTVTYDGKAPWYNIVPYVSVSDSRNWTSSQTQATKEIRLEGDLTLASYLGYSGQFASDNTNPVWGRNFPTGYIHVIRDAFARNYKNIVVKDENGDDILNVAAAVKEISFPSQNLINLLSYSVTLEEFNQLDYSGINPKEEISLEEGDDGIVKIAHTISAQAVNSPFNLLGEPENFNSVKTFVTDRTGASNLKVYLDNSFIATGSGISGVFLGENSTSFLNRAVLETQVERINRLEGLYEIQETYKIDTLRESNKAVKRYSLTYNSGINDDYVVVQINGEIEGSKDATIEQVTGMVNVTEMYNLATGFANISSLYTVPINLSVKTVVKASGFEDAGNSNFYTITGVTGDYKGQPVVSVSCAFDNSYAGTFFDHEVTLETDEVEEFCNLNIEGVIRGRGLYNKQRYEDASSFLTSKITTEGTLKGYLYRLAISGFGGLTPDDTGELDCMLYRRSGQSFGFNPIPESMNVNVNSGVGEIQLSASFTDRPNSVSGYSEFSWSVDVNASTQTFIPKASAEVGGYYLVQDLQNQKRTNATFQGNFKFISGSIPVPTAHAGILTKLLKAENYTINPYTKSTITSATTNQEYVESFSTTLNSGDASGSGFNYAVSKPYSAKDGIPEFNLYKV